MSAYYKGALYFSWIDNLGNVILRTQYSDNTVSDTVIHSFSSSINRNRGSADDHAAPAILLDEKKEELIIAASYHGTPMYIYTYDLRRNNNEVLLVKEITGRYTYPRLFKHKGTILLLARLQPKGIRGGHLVMRSNEDDFDSEQLIISSNDGEVVYAGLPTITDQGFAIAYSKYSYKQRRLIGFTLLKYDLENKLSSNRCDLSDYIEPHYYSNRPTGIGYDGENIVVSTTYTNRENGERTGKYENFERRNTVVILYGQLGKCESFKIIEKREVGLPYYHTSVAVNDMLEWFYFDESQHHTNADFPECFTSDKMMYPNLTENGIVYAAMNRQYSIRDFNNSILYCARRLPNQ